MPRIETGALKGVNHACPVDSQGHLKGVGMASEYHCGAENADGTFEFCKGASGSGDSDVQCAGVPSDSVQCLEDCGDWWYQCANGAAFVKPVPVGTKCKGAAFVVEAVCAASGSTVAPSPSSTPSSASQSMTVAPEPTAAPTTAASSTAAPAPTECGSCSGCLASNGVCYPESKAYCDLYPQYTWCAAGVSSTVAPSSESSTTSTAAPTAAPTTTAAPTPAPTAAPTAAPTTPAPTAAPTPASGSCVDVQGTQCSHCMASNNVFYAQPKAWCDTYSYHWCGSTSLLQQAASPAPRLRGFLAPVQMHEHSSR